MPFSDSVLFFSALREIQNCLYDCVLTIKLSNKGKTQEGNTQEQLFTSDYNCPFSEKTTTGVTVNFQFCKQLTS